MCLCQASQSKLAKLHGGILFQKLLKACPEPFDHVEVRAALRELREDKLAKPASQASEPAKPDGTSAMVVRCITYVAATNGMHPHTYVRTHANHQTRCKRVDRIW